ncbi:MAG: 2-oxoacid:acceptor oxidoreductase family protein [Clostridia bacterium]|jgi:2-oxoglutarate ferredoxin oxidoreductase subunit gamma|nr:2-oxoacid:ferredoxin oxidoreductase subunit gamma [Clostridiales bacterium]
MSSTEIRLSGSGGQGLLLAGIILAEAAILDGKNAVQTQSYGPEARGGASKSEVIISEGDIYYPKVRKPNVFLALTQEAYNKYVGSTCEEGVIIADESVEITDVKCAKKYSLPILDTAKNVVGRAMVANIVALGTINEITGLVSPEALEKAVLNRVPKGTEELNRKALETGREICNIK